jgi:hypothetical protein
MMLCWRNPGPVFQSILLSALLGPAAYAQSLDLQPRTTSSSVQNAASQQPAELAESELPDAPGLQNSSQPAAVPQATATVTGIVLDPNGAQIKNAFVTLVVNGTTTRSTITDAAGVFEFTSVEAGTIKISITSIGFTSWEHKDVLLTGQHLELPSAELQIASAATTVDVIATSHDIAQEQIELQEKQRILGFIPNFYVSYIWNATPLSSGQKFRLAVRTSIDPVSIGISGVIAGVELWQNDFSGYGQGASGYFKRFGASYADGFIGNMIGGAILPTIFRQDPRYFYKGTGTITSRALYAISTVVICKGDNGHWQPNYSNVLGNIASAGISNIYYPAANRDGAGLTVENALIGTAGGAIGALFQEFLIKKISRGVQPLVIQPTVTQPVLVHP